MHGVFIVTGVEDWEIVQHEDHFGILSFSGTYQSPQSAAQIGIESAYPLIRVLSEEDNSQLIPWTRVNHLPNPDSISGNWDMELKIPAGGLYRIETGLNVISTQPDLKWIFRGDVRVHIGIGDLFVIAGQSNASGYGRDSAYDPPDTMVHLYRNRDKWDLACHPMNESTFAADHINAEMGICGTSPYLAFGKAFNKLSHYPVGLIMTALGGSPISRWNPLQNGDLYQNMLVKINRNKHNIAGILWYQGCSDTTPELSATYALSFTQFVQSTREDLGYDIPIFTFQLNRQLNSEFNETWGLVREAQRQSANSIPGVYVLPTLHSSLCDGIHNSAHSSILLGESLAKQCACVLYGKKDFFAPDITKADYKNTVLRLDFSNVERSILMINSDPQNSGFQIQDVHGIVPITSMKVDTSTPSSLLITLERNLIFPADISYGWESSPYHVSFFDEATFMPLLSFYKFPIKIID